MRFSIGDYFIFNNEYYYMVGRIIDCNEMHEYYRYEVIIAKSVLGETYIKNLTERCTFYKNSYMDKFSKIFKTRDELMVEML